MSERQHDKLSEQIAKQFQHTIEMSQEAVFWLGRNGQFSYVNEKACRSLGYTREELLSLFLWDVDPDFPKERWNNHWESLTKIHNTTLETRHRRKDGHIIQVEVFASQISFEGKAFHTAFVRDISERKQVEDALRKSEAAYRSLFEHVPDGILIADQNSYYLDANPMMCKILGYSLDELITLHATDIVTPDETEYIEPALNQIKTRGDYRREWQFKRKDGSIFPAEVSVTKIPNGNLLALVHDITERKQIELELKSKKEHLKHLAYHDSLTDLPNRTLLLDRLTQAMDRVGRNNSQLALFFLDLDLFKKVNDTLGHQVGDLLLQEVSVRLQSLLRKVDTVARFGGDEFVILVEDFSDTEQVASLAQKILTGLEPAFSIEGHLCYISASIGISLYSSSEDNIGNLLKHADIAMYAAKDMGRNNFQFYSKEMDSRAHELLLLENDLRQALSDEQFLLHYQPQLDLNSGRIIGLEALVRWQHPGKGLIPPDDFIPLAEETGLIVPIGTWVLRTACTFALKLQEQGIPPLRMSVNLSMPQFKAQDLPALVSQILDETGLEPQWLELEITENIAMENARETISRLTALRKMGVSLAIDDFGKGHSSLSHLKHIPTTTLKIDRGFVNDILTDKYDLAIVEAILTLTKTLEIEVIAEGIETQEQKQLLCRLGCKLGQGFLFSHPLPSEEILALCSLERPFEDLF